VKVEVWTSWWHPNLAKGINEVGSVSWEHSSMIIMGKKDPSRDLNVEAMHVEPRSNK